MIMPPQSRSRQVVHMDDTPPPMSHTTQVEQSRAVAQVEAAMVAAKRFPRDEVAAVGRMRAATQRIELARVGFYRYRRGTSQVTGSTVHVARELARVWGNIDYGVAEINRDPRQQQSEMLAYAWDLETNARSTTTFIVPWVRDANGQLVPLEDPRSVYENNANMGARRVREMIRAVMPGWLFDEAEARLRQAIENKDADTPMETRRVNAVEAFGKFGVVRRQLEDKLGRKADEWTPGDIVTLTVIHDSLVRHETTVAEEFGARPSRSRAALDEQPDRAAEEAEEDARTVPPSARPAERSGAADSGDPWAQPGAAPGPQASEAATEPAPAASVATPSGPVAMTEETARAVSAWFEQHGLVGEGRVKMERRNWVAREVLGMPDLATIGDLDDAQGRELVARLAALGADEAARFTAGGGR